MFKTTAIVLLLSLPIVLSAQTFDQYSEGIASDMSNGLWIEAGEKIDYCLLTFDLEPITEAGLNHNLGYCLLQREDYIGAKFYLQNALNAKYAYYKGKNADYARSAQLLGDLSLKIGDYEQAFVYLSDAQVSIASDLGEHTDENVEALISLGQYYEAMGNFNRAHQYFDESLTISEEIHHQESPEYANVINHIGRIFVRNSELELADKYLQRANQIYHGLGEKYTIEYVESLENLAMLYERKGDFAQAEKLLLSIEREKRSIEGLSEELLLETLNDLGILYLDLGNIGRSKGYFEEVKAISEKHLGQDHKYFATSINNLAAIAKIEGEYNYSQSLLLDALEIYGRLYGEDHPQYSNALNNLASVERLLGAYEDSEEHYKDVLRIDKLIYGENHPTYATGMNNLGILYSNMGKLALAGQCYMVAKDIRKKVLGVNHPSYARSLENLGLHYYSINKLSQAEQYLSDAIDIQIAQIATIFPSFTERERAIFYNTIRQDIERYTFIASKLLDERPELIQKILNHQIATKGILFSSADRVRKVILNSDNDELIKSYTEWSDATQRLAGYYQLGQDKMSQYGIDLASEELTIESMEKSLMYQSDVFEQLLANDQIDWKDIRRQLKNGQVLVEVIRFREFSNRMDLPSEFFGFTDKVNYLFIILKPDTFLNPEYVIMDNGAALEVKGFSLYKNSVKYEQELRTSYINYWEAIDLKIGEADNVIISPDGVYFKMNLNVLKSSSDGYLLDKYFVNQVTRTRDLVTSKNPFGTEPTAVLVGNPSFGSVYPNSRLVISDLPGAQQEIDDLSAMFSAKGWGVQKMVNTKASEARVRNVFQPSVLHIATHGFFVENDPVLSKVIPGNNPMFKSGLFLRGAMDAYQNYKTGSFQDPQDDGILSSAEAMSLNLNKTRLVVLSACETARGDIELGEGVYGLQRAIFTAGAQNLITSMTKVDDQATRLLMTYFYKQFLETNNVLESFKAAQIKLREDYPDPSVWGAFILTGNG